MAIKTFYGIKKSFFHLRHEKDEKSYIGTSNSNVVSNAFST